MDAHCLELQKRFVATLSAMNGYLSPNDLVVRDLSTCGRFLTFRTPDAERIAKELARDEIIVDSRGDRLRIGFGIYQDQDDIDRLVAGLRRIG
jgi:kynureninase